MFSFAKFFFRRPILERSTLTPLRTLFGAALFKPWFAPTGKLRCSSSRSHLTRSRWRAPTLASGCFIRALQPRRHQDLCPLCWACAGAPSWGRPCNRIRCWRGVIPLAIALPPWRSSERMCFLWRKVGRFSVHGGCRNFLFWKILRLIWCVTDQKFKVTWLIHLLSIRK